MRLNTDGTFDTSFGTGGLVHSALPGVGDGIARFFSVKLDSQGRIVAGGEGEGAVVARYHTDGSLDTTFGDGGVARNPFGNDATDIAIDSDGKIIVPGGAGGHFGILRFTANGAIDTTFGVNGGATAFDGEFTKVGRDIDVRATHIALQSDGKIIAVGDVDYGIDAPIARFDGTAGPAAPPLPVKESPQPPVVEDTADSPAPQPPVLQPSRAIPLRTQFAVIPATASLEDRLDETDEGAEIL